MVQPVPSTEFPTPAIRPANSLLDSQKIKTTFGVNLPSWQEDVRKFVKEVSKKVVL
jgi:dTDP-4-dehydrorhamnose reductase